METLDTIAKKYDTDKSSLVHDYCKKYERIIPFQRDEKFRMLEIGVLNGASLKMWSEYFPNAEIIGVDINPKCKCYENGNIKVEIGSQNDPVFLNLLGEKYGSFDLVVDDGSHIQQHVICSFETLFPYLKNNNLYIVEDVVTSYWHSHGGGLRKPGTMVEYFKNLIDDVNFHGIASGLHKNNQPHPHARRDYELIQAAKAQNKQIRLDIEALMFYNSIIVIKKNGYSI